MDVNEHSILKKKKKSWKKTYHGVHKSVFNINGSINNDECFIKSSY